MTQSIAPKKLCWNCDGNVDMETTECPYCGTDLSAPVQEHSSEEPVDLAPPYALEELEETQEALVQEPQPAAAQQATIPEEVPTFNGVIPMGLLIASGIFTIFGFALFLHSDDPTFTLSWQTSQWPVYLLPGLFLGYLGYKQLPQED